MAADLSHRDEHINDDVLLKNPLRCQLDAAGRPCGLSELKENEVVRLEDGGTSANTAEGARRNLKVFSEEEITDIIVHNVKYTSADIEAKDFEQIVVDTKDNLVKVTLPSPSCEREIVIVSDGAGAAQENPIKVVGKDKTINGEDSFIIDVNHAEVSFKYMNGQWRAAI